MAENVRESLLLRSVAIAEAQTGIVKVMRNSLVMSETALPAINIFDANEQVLPERQPDRGTPGRARPGAPILVTLLPEFLLMLKDRPDDVGSVLGGYVNRLVAAVLLDSTLIGLCTNAGAVRYLGFDSDLQQGRELQGSALVRFAYDYVMHPTRLI